MVAERCFQALDHERVEFRDTTGRCAVASTGTAVVGVGLCVLAAPEIALGAIIIFGVVVVAVAIKEQLDAYELRHRYPEEAGTAQGTRGAPQEDVAQRTPQQKPEPAGLEWQPPVPALPVDPKRHASCEPIPVPRASKDAPHNECADMFPPNRYPGMDVSVDGIRFDALQVGARVLWEIKTHRFDSYRVFIQDREIEQELRQLDRERDAALACGYDFVVGVSTHSHRAALLKQDSTFKVVVTGCER